MAVLTFMLVDSDPVGQRQLLELLSIREHRVVPVPAGEAADLIRRLRFDAVLWAIHPQAPQWDEFEERIRAHVSSFVLLHDGDNPERVQRVEERGGFLLLRPVQESELDSVLEKITNRHSAASCPSTYGRIPPLR